MKERRIYDYDYKYYKQFEDEDGGELNEKEFLEKTLCPECSEEIGENEYCTSCGWEIDDYIDDVDENLENNEEETLENTERK